MNLLRGDPVKAVPSINLSFKLFLYAVIFWTLGITVARAIRLPNIYAKCHWLFDYRFGFMKRGLVGAVCNNITAILGKTVTSDLISILSGIAFGLFIIGMILIMIDLLEESGYEMNVILLIAVFVSSPFIVMSAHIFGYFDNILYLILMLSIYFVEKKLFLTAAVISSAAILIHESYLVIGVPLLYFSVFMKCCSDDKEKKPRVRDIIFMSLPIFVFIFLFVYGTINKDNELNSKLYHYLNSFDYISTNRRRGVSHWQTISFFELFRTQSRFFMRRLFQLDAIAVFVPGLIIILQFIYASFKIKVLSFRSIFLQIVILAPLTMHIIAFDTIRLSLNSVGIGFLTIWVLKKDLPFFKFDPGMIVPAFIVLAVNFFTRVPLMDNCVDGFTNIQRALFYLPLFAVLIFFIADKTGSEKINKP